MVFFIVLYSVFINFFISSNRQLKTYSFLIGRITTVVEYGLYTLLFYQIIESRVFKKAILVTSALAGLYLLYALISSPNNSFDSIPSGVTSLILLVYCISYLFERVKDPDSLFLYSSPVFWVVVATIIYSAGTFFPFIYAQSHMAEHQFVNEYDLIHDTLYIVKNLMFAVAMLIKETKFKSPYPMNKRK